MTDEASMVKKQMQAIQANLVQTLVEQHKKVLNHVETICREAANQAEKQQLYVASNGHANGFPGKVKVNERSDSIASIEPAALETVVKPPKAEKHATIRPPQAFLPGAVMEDCPDDECDSVRCDSESNSVPAHAFFTTSNGEKKSYAGRLAAPEVNPMPVLQQSRTGRILKQCMTASRIAIEADLAASKHPDDVVHNPRFSIDSGKSDRKSGKSSRRSKKSVAEVRNSIQTEAETTEDTIEGVSKDVDLELCWVPNNSWGARARHEFNAEEFNYITDNNRTVFADADAMKLQVREAILTEAYDVKKFYKQSGICQLIARSDYFEQLCVSVIALNAIWIAIDVDHGAAFIADAPVGFQVVAHLFCSFFTSEIIIRYVAFQDKCKAFQDSWFLFDLVLVLLMIAETWVFSILNLILNISTSGLRNTQVIRLLKLARLTRLARMARLMKAFPEVMIILQGISAAARAVFVTIILLLFVIYIFAILFTQLCQDSVLGRSDFKTVPRSVYTLLIRGNLPDLADLSEKIEDQHFLLWLVFMVFVLISAITLLNMLVGILVDVVRSVSIAEKEKIVVQSVKTKLRAVMKMKEEIDEDKDGFISQEEFESILLKPETARMIQSVGVDVVELVDDADFIFGDAKSRLDFKDFMNLILQLRGTNSATVKDLMRLRQVVITNILNSEGRTTAIYMEHFTELKKLIEPLTQLGTDTFPLGPLRPLYPAAPSPSGLRRIASDPEDVEMEDV